MKKIISLAFLSFVFFATECLAGVTFIVDSPQHSSRVTGSHSGGSGSPDGSGNNSAQQCMQSGYGKTSCPEGKFAVERCSYNSSYFKYCCPNAYTNDTSLCD